jgi:hypothetical protein
LRASLHHHNLEHTTMTDSTPAPAATPAPTDAQLEAQIASFDPVFDVPGPVSVKGNPNLPELSLQALPPEARDIINAKLAGVTPGNRNLFEREFVTEEATRLAFEARVKAGVGEGATPYQRVCFEIANQVRLLDARAAALTAELQEVTRYENGGFDAETGQPLAIPVPRWQGDNRTARQNELNEIAHRKALLEGHEGAKLRDEAMAATKAQMKETREALEDHAEAERMARTMERDARIKRMAEAKAKFLRPTGI